MLSFVKGSRVGRIVRGWSVVRSGWYLYFFGGFRPCGLRRTLILCPRFYSYRKFVGDPGFAVRCGPAIVLWFK